MLSLLSLMACKNSCQQLCAELRDYASECGYDFSKDQLSQCYQDFRRRELEQGETQTCSTVAPNLRDEWTCDDFEDYFDGGASQPDTGA